MANTKKTRITLVALLLSQMMTFGQTAIPLVYDKECANDNFRVPEMPAIDKFAGDNYSSGSFCMG